jgi:2-polyprenyl-6-methoxyphenol hydroxylase-like FAD-dependent oxidoreductase
MSAMDTRHPVVIVGAGPGGAALALILAERGIPVTLLERHADFGREFRGEGLQQSGLTCLAQMGLAAEVERLPHCRVHRLRIAVGRTVVHLDAKGLGANDTRLMPQPPLLELLTRKAAAQASFSLRMGVRARGLVQQGDRVVGVEIESDGGSEQLPAALVIGTDGRSSMVRKRAGIEIQEIGQTFDILWSRGDLGDFLPAGTVHSDILRDGGMAAVFPSALGGHQIGVVIEKGGFRQLREQGEDKGLAWVAERCSTALASALRRAPGMARPVLLDVICGRATQWTRPGLLLLGDAAHPMSPVGAQGINMALRDAIVAANHLVPVLRGHPDPAALDTATRRIEAERLPEIIAAQELQTKESRNLRQRSPVAMALMPFLVRLAPMLRWALRRRSRLRRGFVQVELRV